MLILLLELLVLVIALAQFARLAMKPGFRMVTVWRPGWKWPLVMGGMTAGALGLWAWVRWPIFRHVAAAILAAVMLAAWWRARPSYGRRRRLPPGSLGIGVSLDALERQGFYLEQARQFGPVFKTSEFGNPVICVVGLSRIRAILAEHAECFAGTPFTRPYNRFIPRGVLRYMDRSTHQQYAPPFRSTYGGLELNRASPVLRTIFGTHLHRLAADGPPGGEGVLVHGYIRRAMLEAIGFVLYGLHPGNPSLDTLERWMPVLNAPIHRSRGWQRRTTDAMRVLGKVLKDQASQPTPLPGGFRPALRALVGTNPAALEDPTVAGNFILIAKIAHGDLTGLHMWIFKKLCEHAEALEPIRRGLDPTPVVPGAESNPAVRIVKETLRMEQSEFLFRAVVRAFDYQGLRIPRASRVRFCIQESHRDPEVFPDPDRFDPDRFARRTYSREEYAPFGLDAHGCMGSEMAHFLGGLFVEELARFDWRVTDDGPPEMTGNRHRDHWRPSSKLRVTMTTSLFRPDGLEQSG